MLDASSVRRRRADLARGARSRRPRRASGVALGGAANVAQNVVASVRCGLVAVIGDDEAGARFGAMLAGTTGLSTEHLVTSDRCTTQKTRVVARGPAGGAHRRGGGRGAHRRGHVDALVARARWGGACRRLILEDYNKGVLDAAVIDAGDRFAARQRLPIVVDPKFRNFFRYRGRDGVQAQSARAGGRARRRGHIEHPDALPSSSSGSEWRTCCSRWESAGCCSRPADGASARIPTVAREVYDVVGAGDTVTAYLATMLAAGATPIEAAEIANIAAGIEVGKLGAASVSRDELLEYVDAHSLHV